MNTKLTFSQNIYAAVKKVLPRSLASFLRSFFTALWTPLYFTYANGHFKSSFKNKSVARDGSPLPWYTYPIIDFLGTRSFSDKIILEFGGGQSTNYWAKSALKVITLEDDKDWFDQLKKQIPSNVELFLVSKEIREKCAADVVSILTKLAIPHFDLVIIDGLCREEMIEIAIRYVASNGGIICDNAEGYGFYDGFIDKGFQRIDFFGHAPGVMIPHCTSLYFKENCFLLDSHVPIPERK